MLHIVGEFLSSNEINSDSGDIIHALVFRRTRKNLLQGVALTYETTTDT